MITTLLFQLSKGLITCQCGNSLKQKEIDKRIKSSKKDKASRVDMKKYMKQEKLENNALAGLAGLKLK